MTARLQQLFTENPLNSDVVLLKSLEFGKDYVGGHWRHVQKKQMKVSRISGGQSNFMFLVATSSDSSATPFLIRIHRQSQGHVFQDTVNFAVFSERGLGPKLFGFFEGGRLEEFLPSRTMDLKGVQDPRIAQKVGSVLPKYHSIRMPLSKNRRSIQVIREWLDDYKALGGGDYRIQTRTVSSYSEHPETVSVDDILRELETFEKWAEPLEDTVVYCHNDLTCGNVLQMESTGEMVLIDWEFSSYNWRGFDLAMFVGQCAVDFRVPSPPGVRFLEQWIDFPPTIRVFCEAYLDADNQMKGRCPLDREAEIQGVIEECQFFLPLIHLFWAVSCMKRIVLKVENGVDLEVEAGDRLAIYYHLRERSERIAANFRQRCE